MGSGAQQGGILVQLQQLGWCLGAHFVLQNGGQQFRGEPLKMNVKM